MNALETDYLLGRCLSLCGVSWRVIRIKPEVDKLYAIQTRDETRGEFELTTVLHLIAEGAVEVE